MRERFTSPLSLKTIFLFGLAFVVSTISPSTTLGTAFFVEVVDFFLVALFVAVFTSVSLLVIILSY